MGIYFRVNTNKQNEIQANGKDDDDIQNPKLLSMSEITPPAVILLELKKWAWKPKGISEKKLNKDLTPKWKKGRK